MEFEELFQEVDPTAEHLDRIPVALYHQTEYAGITQEKLERIFADSEVHLSLFALDQYLSKLDDRGYINRTELGGYKLTPEGRGLVEQHRDDNDANPFGSSDFVREDDLPEKRWQDLADEINRAVFNGLPSAAAVLYRTLIEDLLYICLNRHPDDDITSYEELDDDSDGPNRRDKGISDMIETLDNNSSKFVEYDRDIDELVDRLENMRDLGNDAAHGLRYNPTMSELREQRDDARKAVKQLVDIMEEQKTQTEDNQTEPHGEALGSFLD